MFVAALPLTHHLSVVWLMYLLLLYSSNVTDWLGEIVCSFAYGAGQPVRIKANNLAFDGTQFCFPFRHRMAKTNKTPHRGYNYTPQRGYIYTPQRGYSRTCCVTTGASGRFCRR